MIAPDKFGGTLSAAEAAEAIARGWRRGDPEAELVVTPVADGGEGTLDTLLSALDGDRRAQVVTGPLGDPVEADIGLLRTHSKVQAIVEMAAASGLHLVPVQRRDPTLTTTRGTGELILAAARERPRRIVVCLGGSATNDGGAGMAQALGVRLLDAEGRELGSGGAALRDLASIDTAGLTPELQGIDIVAVTDVDSPLTGPAGASAIFGPQKGASPDDVRTLDEALRHYATVIHEQLGIDVDAVPGAGAAGGLGAGIIAFLRARVGQGFAMVAEALDLKRRLRVADVAVTGEGRFDEQTSRGKAPAGVLRMARHARCRTVLIAGQVADGVRPQADLVIPLSERAGSVEAAMAGAREHLEAAAESAAREMSGRP